MTTSWTDPKLATDWANSDAQRDLLDLPRRIAAEIVALDRPEARCVVDIGSGPGAFLASFLDRLPEASGLWTDVSPTMEEFGRDGLRRFDGRVEYRILDMTDLAGLPPDADAIITSRAAHHLDRDGLRAFYRAAAAHLAPGGWLVNLDHVGPSDVWDKRLRAARGRLVPRVSEQKPHHHNYPLTSIEDHLTGLADAGLSEVEMPWRSFITCLFMARRG